MLRGGPRQPFHPRRCARTSRQPAVSARKADSDDGQLLEQIRPDWDCPNGGNCQTAILIWMRLVARSPPSRQKMYMFCAKNSGRCMPSVDNLWSCTTRTHPRGSLDDEDVGSHGSRMRSVHAIRQHNHYFHLQAPASARPPGQSRNLVGLSGLPHARQLPPDALVVAARHVAFCRRAPGIVREVVQPVQNA